MKKYFLILILLSTQLFAITEEQYHEFMNNMTIKIGIHTYYNNIDYNGKYLVNWKDSRFYNTDLNNQYKLNSHFSSGFSVDLDYKKYSVNYGMQLLENNISTPSPMWCGGIHKDAYKVVISEQTLEDSLYGLENINKSHNLSYGYQLFDNFQILLGFIYQDTWLQNSSAYNDSWWGDNWVESNHKIMIFGFGGDYALFFNKDKYKLLLSPMIYPYCQFKNQYTAPDISTDIEINKREKFGFAYSFKSSISTNWQNFNIELGYRIQHIIQDKNFSMFTKGVTFETSWTF